MFKATLGRASFEGRTLQELTGAMMRDRRRLYSASLIPVEEDGRRAGLLVKTRAKLCPDCGRVFGRHLCLMTTVEVGHTHLSERCPECRSPRGEERRKGLAAYVRTQFRDYLDESAEYLRGLEADCGMVAG